MSMPIDAPANLLVEDNPDDAELTRIAFDDAGCRHRIEVARDGVEALDYLFARGRHTGRAGLPPPALVLLDLNLPRRDGREVLQAIREHPQTAALPVVVLTTSAEPPDVDTLYALGASSYMRKPVEFDHFVDAVRQIMARWLQPGAPDA